MNPEDLLEAALDQLLVSSGFRTIGDGVADLADKFLSAEVEYKGTTATRYVHCENPAIADDWLDAVACLGKMAGARGLGRIEEGLRRNREAGITDRAMVTFSKQLDFIDVQAVMPEVPYFASGLCS